MTKKQALLLELKDCVLNLEKVLDEPKSDIVRDSAIKRFDGHGLEKS